ncbi:TPA: hypothetical protein ACJISV_000538 [Campylobacter jejuni]
MNLLQCEICQITRSFLNTEVAYNYAVDNTTIMSHKNLHSDELIENIHYFYDYAQTKGGRQRVIKWTLEGVYKLFDKIKKLKERSNMTEEKLLKSLADGVLKINESSIDVAVLENGVRIITHSGVFRALEENQEEMQG